MFQKFDTSAVYGSKIQDHSKNKQTMHKYLNQNGNSYIKTLQQEHGVNFQEHGVNCQHFYRQWHQLTIITGVCFSGQWVGY